MWFNPHRIFRPINVGLREKNNSSLWRPKKYKRKKWNCNRLRVRKLRGQILHESKQSIEVDIQEQPKMKDNLPSRLKAGENKTKVLNFFKSSKYRGHKSRKTQEQEDGRRIQASTY